MEQILQQLTVSQKKNIIKGSDKLSELFKTKISKSLSKAKGEDIDNFINDLSKEDMEIILDASSSNSSEEKTKSKTKSKKSEEDSDNGEVAKEEKTNDIQENSSEEDFEEKEIPENLLRKIFKDLYPTSIHKTKYIQENPSLKMSALTKGIFGKNVKKEYIDDFLVKQVPKTPKSMKQLALDWLENKKTLKLDTAKLASDSLKKNDVKTMLDEVSMEDFETYCFLMQQEVNENVFDYIENIKEEEQKMLKESGAVDSEKVKELESKLSSLEKKLSEQDSKHKDEVSSLKQNYELEKDKLKSKYEQRIETNKTKFDEEKSQLIKIQADSDRRFAEEKNKFSEHMEKLETENKKLNERINNIGSDLISQNKQHKDATKELTRIYNRIEELQEENKELTTKNEELKYSYELLSTEIQQLKKQEISLQEKVQELSIQIQELEKTKVAFMLNEAEIQGVIKEINAVDETKERMLQLLNIDTRHTKTPEDLVKLDDLWVKLIEQEENILADYLSVGVEVVSDRDTLKEKIDSLLDLEYNLKAREVLVKVLYERGYKAYKSF